jgi:Kef-type K+ transport system membrane component KefB
MMNCRGLTELIILNTGLSAGLLSPSLFAMLVLMALATTAVTGPLLRLLSRERDKEPA